jgi:hypothetical protein
MRVILNASVQIVLEMKTGAVSSKEKSDAKLAFKLLLSDKNNEKTKTNHKMAKKFLMQRVAACKLCGFSKFRKERMVLEEVS